jgi:hypothetical protein
VAMLKHARFIFHTVWLFPEWRFVPHTQGGVQIPLTSGDGSGQRRAPLFRHIKNRKPPSVASRSRQVEVCSSRKFDLLIKNTILFLSFDGISRSRTGPTEGALALRSCGLSQNLTTKRRNFLSINSTSHVQLKRKRKIHNESLIECDVSCLNWMARRVSSSLIAEIPPWFGADESPKPFKTRMSVIIARTGAYRRSISSIYRRQDQTIHRVLAARELRIDCLVIERKNCTPAPGSWTKGRIMLVMFILRANLSVPDGCLATMLKTVRRSRRNPC